jgi:hypothetical protein
LALLSFDMNEAYDFGLVSIEKKAVIPITTLERTTLFLMLLDFSKLA